MIRLTTIIRGDMDTDLQCDFSPLASDCIRGHFLTLKINSAVFLLVYPLSRRVTNLRNALPTGLGEQKDDAGFKRRLDEYSNSLWITASF